MTRHDNPILKFLRRNHSFVEIGSQLYSDHRELLFQCGVCGLVKCVVERKHK